MFLGSFQTRQLSVLSIKESYLIKNAKKRIFHLSKAKFLGKLSIIVQNKPKLGHLGVKGPDFTNSECRNRCQIFFAPLTTQKLFKNKKVWVKKPKRGFRRPDFKTCHEDFEHFQTSPNYTGTFCALKIEKPEKVVSGSSKSVSGVFSESLHKKKFFELPCRGGLEFSKTAKSPQGLSKQFRDFCSF